MKSVVSYRPTDLIKFLYNFLDLKFLLKREAEQVPAYVKVWIKELRKIKNADIAILFGSVLRKKEEKVTA